MDLSGHYHTMRMTGMSEDGYWELWQCTGCTMHTSKRSVK